MRGIAQGIPHSAAKPQQNNSGHECFIRRTLAEFSRGLSSDATAPSSPPEVSNKSIAALEISSNQEPNNMRRQLGRLAMLAKAALIGLLWSGLASSVVLCSLEVHGHSALTNYYYRNWTRGDGLPDNQVNAILQTRDGYVWAATERGLARFDGVRFAVFDKQNTPELVSDACRCLAEDMEGNLWIGTKNGLLCRSIKGFNRYTFSADTMDCEIVSLCPSRSGGVWTGFVVADHPALAHVMQNSVRVLPCGHSFGMPSSIVEDEAGGVLVAADLLHRVDPQNGMVESIAPPYPLSVPLILLAHVSRSMGKAPLVCFLDLMADIYCCWLKDGNLELFWPGTGSPNLDFQPGTSTPTGEFLNVWLPPRLVFYSRHSAETGLELSHNVRIGLHADALCATEDRDGNTWIGTRNSGLVLLRPTPIQNITSRDGILGDNVWALCEATDGTVWIGTDGGLTHFGKHGCTRFTEREGLPRDTVRALALDQSGRLWVGTGGGLCSIRNGKVVSHSPQNEWTQWKTRAIVVARDGSIWAGTVSGLYRINGNRTARFGTADGLPADDVRAILEDRSGNLWIGTAGGGLCRLDTALASSYINSPTNGAPRVNPFTERFSSENGLLSNSVWALYQDSEGVLWIGTERGLNRLRDGQLAAFTTAHGLPANLVNHLVEDDFGYLWVSHDHGIYRVPKAQLDDLAAGRIASVLCETFDEEDGLLSIETNGQKSQPAAIKTRDGRLWFATSKGAAVFDPANLPGKPKPPIVVIEEVRADGRLLFDNGPGPDIASLNSRNPVNAGAPRTALEGTELRFAPGWGRVIEVAYTAGSYVQPEKIRFRHRLIGVDTDWQEAGRNRRATYVNLQPGRYRFEVMAVNSEGVSSQMPAGIDMRFAPYYWQTKWFYGMAAALVIGAVIGIHQWRTSELRKIHTLEKEAELLRERARIAKDLHDGLGGSLTKLTLLAEIESDNDDKPDARQEHLKAIYQSAREAMHTVRDLVWSAHPANDSLESLANRILQYADSMFAASPTRCHFDVPDNLPQVLLLPNHRHQVLYAAKEALNNVLKHASANLVQIRMQAADSVFTIEIKDDGRGCVLPGLPPEESDMTLNEPAHGIQIMRERIESIGGEFRLTSEPGKGTTVWMQIPIRQTETKA